MVLNEIQVFFVSLCFVHANVFQVKLGKTSFSFKFNLTSHLSDDQTPSALFAKFKKKRKVNTSSIGDSHSEVFYKIGFMTLQPENKCYKNTCKPADILGKNWYRPAELFHRKCSNICASNILRIVNAITAEGKRKCETKMIVVNKIQKKH